MAHFHAQGRFRRAAGVFPYLGLCRVSVQSDVIDEPGFLRPPKGSDDHDRAVILRIHPGTQEALPPGRSGFIREASGLQVRPCRLFPGFLEGLPHSVLGPCF